jgi:Zn-finger nucleic acid-binding protein
MNCANCGAAMELIESRRYFRCRHCGSYHFPATVETEGIRISGVGAHAPDCPVCELPMAHAVLDDKHPVDFCTTCRGVLLARVAFAMATNTRRAWATTPPVEPLPVDRRELHRHLTCPKCRGRFETYPHLGPGNVVIDNCVRCDLIWLDFGELRAIEQAPGSDRGSRQLPRVDEEYIREGPSPGYRSDDDDDWPGLRRRTSALALLFGVLGD